MSTIQTSLSQMAPPNDEGLANLFEDLHTGEPQNLTPAPALEPSVTSFFKGQPSIIPTGKVGAYPDIKSLLSKFHQDLGGKGMVSCKIWDDHLIRKFNMSPLLVDAHYIDAFSDGLMIARQTALDTSMKEISEGLALEVKKLQGMKLDFTSQVKEIKQEIIKEIAKVNASAVAVERPSSSREPDHDDVVKSFLRTLLFPEAALSLAEFVQMVSDRFSYSRMREASEGRLSIDALNDLQNQCKSLAEEYKTKVTGKSK